MNTALLFVTALALAGPFDRPAAPADSSKATIDFAIVSLIDDVDVPAQDAGPLQSIAVREGELVQRGALLAQIDDRQVQLEKSAAEMQRDAALARANDDVDVRLAEAAYGVADAELEANLEINRRKQGTISQTEIRRLELSRKQAALQIDRSKLDMRIAQITADVEEAAVKAADQRIARRRIVSPLDGLVVNLYRQAGEWVAAGEPVLRVVRMDRLRVEGFLKANEYDPSEVDGRPVTVEVELARDRKLQFVGEVVFVTPLVQAGNKYRVRAEVENRMERGHWQLRPGTSATVTIKLE